MKDLWPFGVALRGEASNRLMLRWLKTVVVSDEEKAHWMRQVGTRKASESEPLSRCRKQSRWHQNLGAWGCPGMSLAGAVYWPGGARHGGGASLVCGFHAERGKAAADTASAGGPARSSGEAPVIGAGRRGRLIYWFVRTSNRVSPGRRRVSRSGPEGKPFQIPKQLVWEAYRRVKANNDLVHD